MYNFTKHVLTDKVKHDLNSHFLITQMSYNPVLVISRYTLYDNS